MGQILHGSATIVLANNTIVIADEVQKKYWALWEKTAFAPPRGNRDRADSPRMVGKKFNYLEMQND